MGRVRTTQIKTITDMVISKYGLDKFSEDFESNKKILKDLPEEFPSKTILNKIAGYLTFLYKKHKVEEKKLMTKSE